jgi:hypothetical protein
MESSESVRSGPSALAQDQGTVDQHRGQEEAGDGAKDDGLQANSGERLHQADAHDYQPWRGQGDGGTAVPATCAAAPPCLEMTNVVDAPAGRHGHPAA